ncbi:MAG: prolipoprotein diacylglyceryl transferase, partial [Coriobacteriia bacterium]|nr:prolipoprotein diacylglyceryl transferase [Coriobacteriia bacterium]
MALLTYPNIDPVLLRLGPVQVHWYGLAYVAGFIAAGLLFRRFSQRWGVGLSDDDVLGAVLYCVIGVLLGSRIGYVLFYGGRYYLDDPVRVFALWDGGMAFHGGLAGIIIAGVLFARRVGVPFLRLADMAAVGAPVGFFFGRLANFINGELWGRVTDVPWAMVFPGAGANPRHPSQLYEAVLEGLVMFVVLSVLARRRPLGRGASAPDPR